MKKIELVFILDRSGSMSGLEKDTIEGYNSMLEQQKIQEGEVLVTTVLIDDAYEVVHDRKKISDIKKLTSEEYYVRGTTALLDAIGKTVNKVKLKNEKMDAKDQADQVIFVIITDGMENASQEYSYKKIKNMINTQKEKYAWDFVFLGANMDAVATASQFGIKSDRAVTYHADEEGTKLNYQVLNSFLSESRMGNTINEEWKSDIENDYLKRKE